MLRRPAAPRAIPRKPRDPAGTARALRAPMRLFALALALLLPACATTLDRDPARDAAAADAPLTPDAHVAADAGETTPSDASTPPPLPPPAARPPMGPPDLSHVIAALAAERPDLLASSCVTDGGSYDFLFEAVRRLRAIDPRWGLDRREAPVGGDVVDYYWGDGAPEGATEVYVVDIISSYCPRAGIDAPSGPGWFDVSDRGGLWTILPLGEPPPPPPPPVDGGTTMMPPAPPDGRSVIDALAAERPDLLAASCVADGGNNDFLFEAVRRLRAMDPRWGLNWKRGNVGDLSQDVVDYHWGDGEPEGSTDVFIIDMIGGHCGDSPSAAWTDVTEATRLGGTIGRWTLAGRTDL